MSYDLIIIGSGFSGMVAAAKAVEKKLKFCIVSKGLGASEFFSGSFDFLDDPHYSSDIQSKSALKDAFLSLDRTNQDHLYSKLSRSHQIKSLPDFMKNEAEFFLKALSLDLSGDSQRYVYALDPVGNLRPAAFLRKTNLFDIDSAKEKKINVVSLKNYAYDFSNQILFNLEKLSHQKELQFQVEKIEIDLSCIKNLTDPNPIDLALEFDKAQAQSELLSALQSFKQDILIFPDVLGIQSHEALLSEIQKETESHCIETLSALPSVNGQRLKRDFENFTQEKSIETIKAQVISFDAKSDDLKSITVLDRSSQQKKELKAKSFIIATGKYLGGGMRHQKDQLEESIFSSQIFYQGKAVHQPLSEDFIQDEHENSHPFLSMGLLTDNDFSPLNSENTKAYKNLKATGHILGGFDYTRQNCAFGISLLTSSLLINKI